MHRAGACAASQPPSLSLSPHTHNTLLTTTTFAVLFCAQIGGAAAGYPLGRLQQEYGWDGVQVALAAISVISAVIACTLWSTTAAGRINGRSGTIQDFNAIDKKKSM